MAKIQIANLTTSDGRNITISGAGIVLFVGPNNAGKSQALRDIKNLAQSPANRALVVVGQTINKSGDGAEITSRITPRVDGSETFYDVPTWGSVQGRDIEQQWAGSQELGPLTELFVLLADGTSRLTGVSAQQSIDFGRRLSHLPIHTAYLDGDLEIELDRLCREAFGLELMVDRYAGSQVMLRVGKRVEFEHANGIPSRNYMDEMRKIPQIDQQGDGIKAYMGLLLLLAAGQHDVILIDEPEAFLHPPQARLLGRVLADKSKHKQAFIATHSTDFVQGVLHSEQSTTVVRLTREGSVNKASVLDAESLKLLWADSLLRQSNILDGLFHDAVIVCESDSDCRYYSAVMDHLPPVDELSHDRYPEVLYTYSSTKSRMSVIARALTAVDVPVVVVGDFDLLRQESDLRKLVQAMGSAYDSEMENDQKMLSAQLSPQKPMLKIALRSAVNKAFQTLQGETIDEKQAEALRRIIKGESGWDKAKQGGTKSLPSGDTSRAANRLIARLETIGILIVPVGELERFDTSVGGHGPKWVAEVLEQDLHKHPGQEAAIFVRKIISIASLRAGARRAR